MDRKDEITALSDAFAAHDLILRELLSMIVGLGHFSNAWNSDESDAALTAIAARLRAVSEKQEKNSMQVMVLTEFAKHAEKSLSSSPTGSTPPPRSGGGLQ